MYIFFLKCLLCDPVFLVFEFRVKVFGGEIGVFLDQRVVVEFGVGVENFLASLFSFYIVQKVRKIYTVLIGVIVFIVVLGG